MLLVNTAVDRFTLTVRAMTERFPYYAKTAEYEEMDGVAEELREIVRSIDEEAAVPGCYWPAFIDNVQDGISRQKTSWPGRWGRVRRPVPVVIETKQDAQIGLERMLYDRYPEAQAANGGFNTKAPVIETHPIYETYMRAAQEYLAALEGG